VIVAGRRFGKTYLALAWLIIILKEQSMSRISIVACVLVLAFPGCAKKGDANAATALHGGNATAPVGAPPAPTSSADRERYAKRLDAVAAIVRSVADSAPRDHDDPAVVLSAAGKDPAALLSWVKKQTRPLAYAGTLRGVSGVLMDRAGNSLDRALLLADLLRRAGHVVRLARVDLSPQAVAALRASMTAVLPKPVPPTAPDRGTLLKVFGNNSQLASGLVQHSIEATLKDNERFATTVRELYGRVLPAVEQAVGQDAKRDQVLAAEIDRNLRDHFWVQRQIPTGWEDLDPDEAAVGKLTPLTTFAASEEIPRELKHEVTLRAIVETWQAGKLSETPLLERTWTPAELAGKSLTLSHRLFPEPPPLAQIAHENDPQAALIAALSKAWAIEPVLQVGGEEITDRLFTLRGEALPASPETLRKLGVASGLYGGLGSHVASALGHAFGGEEETTTTAPPDESTSPVKITAEWIEFEIKVPGHPPERHRRAIFDLLGPAARAAGAKKAPDIDGLVKERRALALAGVTDIFIFGATPAEASLLRTEGQGLAEAAEQAAKALRAADPSVDALAEPASRLQLPLWGWALARTWSATLPPASPVSPNVALFWQTPTHERDGANRIKITFDIVANGVASDLSFSHRVAQGVMDTVVEHAMLADGGPGGNTAAIHARDLAAGRVWVRLDPADSNKADRLNLPGDAKARIKADLANGNIVIAQSQPSRPADGGAVGWWRVHPRTGVTLGMGENGRGQEGAEYAKTLVMRGSMCLFVLVGEYSQEKKLTPGSIVGGAFCAAGAGHAALHEKFLQAMIGGVFEMAISIAAVPEWPEGSEEPPGGPEVNSSPATPPGGPEVNSSPATPPGGPEVNSSPATPPDGPEENSSPAEPPNGPEVNSSPATPPDGPEENSSPAEPPNGPEVNSSPATPPDAY
jgi:hypothetical protein